VNVSDLVVLRVGISLASGFLIAICLTAYWTPFVSASAQLPNLAVVEIKLAKNPNWSYLTVLPQVDEKFYVYVGVVNFGDWAAKNFSLTARMSLSENETTSLLRYQFKELDAGVVSYEAYWGPFVVHMPSNLTVVATVNGNHTIAESNYSDNTLTSTFVIGELFPNIQEIPAVAVWNDTQPQTFSAPTFSGTSETSETDRNMLHVVSSRTGDVIAYSSDAGTIKAFRNGTMILHLQIPPDQFPGISLSLSGKFLAISKWTEIDVYDTSLLSSKGEANPVFSIQSNKLGLSNVYLSAVSDDGLLAVAGFFTNPQNNILGHIAANGLRMVNMTSGQVLWSKNLDNLLDLGPDVTGYSNSLMFDAQDELLVGQTVSLWTSSFAESKFYEPNLWLYIINSGGNVVWSKLRDNYVYSSFISADGSSIVVANTNYADTFTGWLSFYGRFTNKTFSLYVGNNVETGSGLWIVSVPLAISPEGDYIAIADRTNVYLLDTSGSPMFRIDAANTTSLALAGGYLQIGGIGKAMGVGLWGPVDREISSAQSTIITAKGNGANVSEAQGMLSQAISARASHYWYQAYSLARGAVAAAQQAPLVTTSVTQTVTPTTGSSISSVGSTSFLTTEAVIGVAVAVVAVIGILVVLSKRKKH
jgi:hypothetical protein